MNARVTFAVAGACMSGAVMVGALCAPAAFARGDHGHGHGGGATHGGHCDYGRGSINILPQCNTNGTGGSAPVTGIATGPATGPTFPLASG